MRVISGKARGTKLETIEKDSTRPTLDRVKESLFNIIQYDIKDKVVLDLFAGSGALGIEALSRGARQCYFCDINKEAIDIINKNIQKTRFTEFSKVYNKDYKSFIKNTDQKFDIIFIDPPYHLGEVKQILELIIEYDILNEDGIMILETDMIERDLKDIESLSNLKKSIKVYDKRKYGRANLIFINEEKN